MGESPEERVTLTWSPECGVIDRIWASSRPVQATTSPPARWNARLYPLLDGVHASFGEADCFDGGGVGLGVGLGVGEGDGDGDADVGTAAGVVGATPRSSAADSGVVRVGAAAINTDRMPNQATPTVTVVATAQAKR